MTDRRLSYVVAVAQYGSMTTAAEHVGVSQSALSKSIAALERQLGYQIFQRAARGVVLTPEGELFVERASRLIDETKSLLKAATTGHDPFDDILRVGCCPASLEYLLASPITSLIHRHKKFRVELTSSNFERMIQLLRTGSVDVALGYDAAFRDQPDVTRDHLVEHNTSFFVRKGHPILERSEITLEDVADFELVTPSRSRPFDAIIREMYEAKGIDPKSQLHVVDYFPLAKKIVRESDAIGFIDTQFIHAEKFKRDFIRVPYHNPRPLSSVCLVVRRRQPPGPLARAFIQACHDSTYC